MAAGEEKEKSRPGPGRPSPGRLGLGSELALALLPTLTIFAVLLLVGSFSNQKLLYGSLASSAFLIYLDPGHKTNGVRTLVLAQGLGAITGYGFRAGFGETYLAAGLAMVATIVGMILLDAVHPPAVSTALGFAFRSGPESNLALFAGAVGLIALLVGLQRASTWILRRLGGHRRNEAALPTGDSPLDDVPLGDAPPGGERLGDEIVGP